MPVKLAPHLMRGRESRRHMIVQLKCLWIPAVAGMGEDSSFN